MYKLPISKYKNTVPKIVKREQILSGISTNRLSNTIGSLINCNLKHITFALDSSSGGVVSTIRHDDLTRKLTFSQDAFHVTHAHSGPITDIQYSIFDQSIVATCGFDSQIQIWTVRDDGESSSPVKLEPLTSLQLNENRSDCVQWNPNVSNVLASTSLNTVYLWDVENGGAGGSHVSAIRAHGEAIQSMSWKCDGSLLVTTSKDKTMHVLDPRNANSNENLKIETPKTANKDSKVVWVGTTNCIFSSVYTQSFQREIHLWDVRNTSAPVHESVIDTGNNVLTPLFDLDASVVYLVGKAETLIRCCEVFLTESAWSFACNSAQQVDDQIKAACALPKFGLDLMKCELDRLLLLTRSSIYPLPYIVPRRAYYDFHSDVFPDTYDTQRPGVQKSEWLSGANGAPNKCPLNPETQKNYFTAAASSSSSTTNNTTPLPPPPSVTKPSTPVIKEPSPPPAPATPSATSSVASLISSMNSKTNENTTTVKVASTPIQTPSTQQQQSPLIINVDKSNKENIVNVETTVNTSNTNATTITNGVVASKKDDMDLDEVKNSGGGGGGGVEANSTTAKSNVVLRNVNHQNQSNTTGATLAPTAKLSSTASFNRKSNVKSVYYQSKFKYINGKSSHKSEHITNIRNLSAMWPSECNGFQVNVKRAAFMLAGSSGQIAVCDLDKPGRLPDASLPSLINKSKVADFAWDPFSVDTLACACDDGCVRIWKIPSDGGLVESSDVPSAEIKAHAERLGCLAYHPYARDVLATASYDRTIKLWNVEEASTGNSNLMAQRTLRGFGDVIFSMSWSPCGTRLATICKDGIVRVFEPLSSETATCEAKCGPGAGSKAARIEWCLNGRALLISGFGKSNARQLFLLDADTLDVLATEDINSSPSLLVPIYDPDINVLYLYAKGEENLYLYEIQENEPYFQVLTPFKADGLHFALAMLPKVECDVRAAEIAKAYRLTKDNRVEKISFTVPRVKLGFFQDDIFPLTLDRSKPYLSARQWFNYGNGTDTDSSSFEFNYINLQPANMDKLTDALAVEQAQPAKPSIAAQRREAELKKANGMDLYNPENLNDDEKKIINSMLHRATLFYKQKSDDDGDDNDNENSDWS